jgi:hypothetical protein
MFCIFVDAVKSFIPIVDIDPSDIALSRWQPRPSLLFPSGVDVCGRITVFFLVLILDLALALVAIVLVLLTKSFLSSDCDAGVAMTVTIVRLQYNEGLLTT